MNHIDLNEAISIMEANNCSDIEESLGRLRAWHIESAADEMSLVMSFKFYEVARPCALVSELFNNPYETVMTTVFESASTLKCKKVSLNSRCVFFRRRDVLKKCKLREFKYQFSKDFKSLFKYPGTSHEEKVSLTHGMTILLQFLFRRTIVANNGLKRSEMTNFLKNEFAGDKSVNDVIKSKAMKPIWNELIDKSEKLYSMNSLIINPRSRP